MKTVKNIFIILALILLSAGTVYLGIVMRDESTKTGVVRTKASEDIQAGDVVTSVPSEPTVAPDSSVPVADVNPTQAVLPTLIAESTTGGQDQESMENKTLAYNTVSTAPTKAAKAFPTINQTKVFPTITALPPPTLASSYNNPNLTKEPTSKKLPTSVPVPTLLETGITETVVKWVAAGGLLLVAAFLL